MRLIGLKVKSTLTAMEHLSISVFFFPLHLQQDLQKYASQFEGAVWNVEHQIYVS